MKRKTKIDKPRPIDQPAAQPALQTKSDRLQTRANWAGAAGLPIAVLSLIFTIFFSWVTYELGKTANDLAQKSFELSQKDTMQDRQLNELRRLFEVAQSQLLVQNQQLSGVNAQLGTVNRHYDLAVHNTESTELANFFKLRYAIQGIDATLPPQGVAYMKKMEEVGRYDVIDIVETLLNGELENTYLTARPDALEKWVDMASRCERIKNLILKIDQGEVFYIDSLGGRALKKPEEKRQLANQWFGIFVDKLYDLSYYNMLEIVQKEKRYMEGRQ